MIKFPSSPQAVGSEKCHGHNFCHCLILYIGIQTHSDLDPITNQDVDLKTNHHDHGLTQAYWISVSILATSIAHFSPTLQQMNGSKVVLLCIKKPCRAMGINSWDLCFPSVVQWEWRHQLCQVLLCCSKWRPSFRLLWHSKPKQHNGSTWLW